MIIVFLSSNFISCVADKMNGIIHGLHMALLPEYIFLKCFCQINSLKISANKTSKTTVFSTSAKCYLLPYLNFETICVYFVSVSQRLIQKTLDPQDFQLECKVLKIGSFVSFVHSYIPSA